MRIFSASAISSSRNWGWAKPIRPSARSQVDLPLTLNFPYSVTIQWRFVRVAVAVRLI